MSHNSSYAARANPFHKNPVYYAKYLINPLIIIVTIS